MSTRNSSADSLHSSPKWKACHMVTSLSSGLLTLIPFLVQSWRMAVHVNMTLYIDRPKLSFANNSRAAPTPSPSFHIWLSHQPRASSTRRSNVSIYCWIFHQALDSESSSTWISALEITCRVTLASAVRAYNEFSASLLFEICSAASAIASLFACFLSSKASNLCSTSPDEASTEFLSWPSLLLSYLQ